MLKKCLDQRANMNEGEIDSIFVFYDYVLTTWYGGNGTDDFFDDANEDFESGQDTLFEPVSLKIGRNDPCYCGSGKKYKNCCIGKLQL